MPRIHPISEDIVFSYFHSLSTPDQLPKWPQTQQDLLVEGDAILRFGFVEGAAVVRGNRVVFDPQGGQKRFSQGGSSASALSVVLNEREALISSGAQDVRSAGIQLLHENQAEVVVIKRGAKGASVFTDDGDPHQIPAFQTKRVFKIGSGDVFSAAFAQLWCEKHYSPVDAALGASRAVAEYVENQSLPLEPLDQIALRKPIPANPNVGTIYLAGPFFTTSQLWLIEELHTALEELGGKVFSPIYEVGLGGAPKAIADKDLEGLRNSACVLAVLDGADPGTLFEIGYARRHGVPVVALAENVPTSDLTMIIGSDCEIVDEIGSAAYLAIWAAIS